MSRDSALQKVLWKGKDYNDTEWESVLKWKESHEYSVNNSCHCWHALRAPEYWAVWVRCGKTGSTSLHPSDSLAQKYTLKLKRMLSRT